MVKKVISRSILVVILVVFSLPEDLMAQMTIDEPSGRKVGKVSFADSIRLQKLQRNFNSPAMTRHQRDLLRKERNSFEVSGGLQGSLTNLSESWIETSGGDNTVTLLASLYLKHTYTKDLFSLESQLSANFGYYRMVLESTAADGATLRDPVWYKNQDEFQFSVTPSRKITQNWSFGTTIKFRSQFAKGYVSSASQEWYNLKSDFMSPGYLDVSGGFIYSCPKEKYPVKITMSPVAMSATYVTNAEVRDNAGYSYLEQTTDNDAGYVEAYGVAPNLRSKYEGGSSIQIDFDRSFGKNNFVRYVTTLYSFYGWMSQVTHKNVYGDLDDYDEALTEWNNSDMEDGVAPMLTIHPTVRWENRIEIKASKLLSTTLNFQLYYNRAQNLKVQTQTLLSVGLAYRFTNK